MWGTGTQPRLVDVTIVENHAVGGGAMLIMSGATPFLPLTHFSGKKH